MRRIQSRLSSNGSSDEPDAGLTRLLDVFPGLEDAIAAGLEAAKTWIRQTAELQTQLIEKLGGIPVTIPFGETQQALERVRLRSAKEAVEEELRASNARLEALLGEVNHRVSNSLQLVSAFVHMQASVLSDTVAKGALLETQQRIQAIAQVHRRLYTSGDVEYVSMDDYLRALVAELEQTWSTPASPKTLRLTADPIKLKTDRAVSLGVIVNELVTNACKYAYGATKSGEVRIILKRAGDGFFHLCVEDDGVGMPKDGRIQGTGLGTKLVRAMASSLQAKIAFDPEHSGVRTTLSVPY